MQDIIFQLKIKKTSIKYRLTSKFQTAFLLLIQPLQPLRQMLRHLYVVRIRHQEVGAFNSHFR